MPILSSCCFCFDLKVGTKIIGILALIGSLLSSLALAGMVVMFVFLGVGVDTAHKLSNSHQPSPSHDSLDDDYADIRTEAKNMMELIVDQISTVTVVLYILLALCLLCVVTSSMLIHGVKRNRRGLLVPYIIQEALNVIALISVDIWLLVVFGTDMRIISLGLSLAGGFLVHLYFGLVVISQYQALGLIRMHEEISMK